MLLSLQGYNLTYILLYQLMFSLNAYFMLFLKYRSIQYEIYKFKIVSNFFSTFSDTFKTWKLKF